MRALVMVLGIALPVATLTLASSARAQETSTGASATFDSGTTSNEGKYAGDSDALPGALVIGAEFGAIFPQPFSELGTHVAFGIELGYRLPMWGQRLEIMADVGYSPPSNAFSDKRDEATYDAKARAKELHVSLGPRFRVMDRASPWNVTIALGPRMYMYENTSTGSRGSNEFATFKEKGTKFGFFVALGGEYNLGPGALFLDLDLGYAKLEPEIMGDANAGNLTATIGYRFFLL
jgi:hypothetical protein